LVKRNNVTDAFVVAYKGEDQITLQELMRGKRSSTVSRDIIPLGKQYEGVTFRVQVLAAKNLKMSVAEFKEQYQIEEEIHIQQFGDLLQLVSKNYTEYKDARDFKRSLIAKGIPDAFVVAYYKNTRISIESAFEINKKIMHD